ncbi:MAG TPA: 50S ribosomal protein L11 methyltransferase [Pilimelia sp.]|nr:50S ribosomal protein L11 methyltransferase [Pilimelia sp.]
MTDVTLAAGFVAAHTRLGPVPFVPEVLLYQAADAIALWETTEAVAGAPLPPPFWAFAWAGGQALARYVLDHPELVAGRTVLDLAAGSGLVAIAAARAGAAAVHANEIDQHALAAIAVNAAANGVPVAVLPGDLLATDAGAGSSAGTGIAADVVLAGDVFYRKPMADAVLPFLRRARRRGADVLVGDPGRAYLPRGAFQRLAAYDVPVVAELEDAAVKRTEVWALPTL